MTEKRKIRGINSNIRKKKPKKRNKKKHFTNAEYWRMIINDPDFHSTHYPDKLAKGKKK